MQSAHSASFKALLFQEASKVLQGDIQLFFYVLMDWLHAVEQLGKQTESSSKSTVSQLWFIFPPTEQGSRFGWTA